MTTADPQFGSLRISVAMCTYNGAKFLDEQLSSISRQSRLPDELVVCDDQSWDGTVKKLQDFAKYVSFPVRIQVNETNLGSTRNFEQAISLCRGEVIALSDQDDIWDDKRLQRTEAVFVRKPSTALMFGHGEIIDGNSSPVGLSLWRSVGFGYFQQFQVWHNRATQALLRQNVVTGATLAFPERLRRFVLPIPEDWMHDGWIALVASFFGEVIALNEQLIHYRRHQDQQIGPPNWALSSRVARAKVTGRSYYRKEVKRHEAAYERLLPHAKTEHQKTILRWIAAKIRHSLARARMPEKRIARIPVVFREYVTMRYTLYSRGLMSALKDLLVENLSDEKAE